MKPCLIPRARWLNGWIAIGLLACDAPGTEGGRSDAAAPRPPMSAVAERLLVLEETGPPGLIELEVNARRTATWFKAPSLSFAYEFTVNRARESIFLAYTPPPVNESDGWSYRSGIYRLGKDQIADTVAPEDTGACPNERDVYCYYPASHENKLWFVRTAEVPSDADPVQLRELDLDTSENRLIANWATEPAVSPNGEYLSWITIDPEDGRRTLVLATIEGEQTRTLVTFDTSEDIGLPFFAADSQSVFYLRIPLTSSWWQQLGDWFIKPAFAHNDHSLPGDWWRVPISGEAPQQVTDLLTVHYDGQADPSGESIFIATTRGVLWIDLRTDQQQVLKLTRAARALDWL